MNLYSFCLAMLVGTLVEFKSAFIITVAVVVITNPEVPVVKKTVRDIVIFMFANTYRDIEQRLQNLTDPADTTVRSGLDKLDLATDRISPKTSLDRSVLLKKLPPGRAKDDRLDN